MRNFIIETIEEAHVRYNVLVEDHETAEDARRKFERGENDGRLVVHDTTDVDIICVHESN